VAEGDGKGGRPELYLEWVDPTEFGALVSVSMGERRDSEIEGTGE